VEGRKSLKRTQDSSTAHQLYVFAVERDSQMLMAENPGRSTAAQKQSVSVNTKEMAFISDTLRV
jgi:hypothetical protein